MYGYINHKNKKKSHLQFNGPFHKLNIIKLRNHPQFLVLRTPTFLSSNILEMNEKWWKNRLSGVFIPFQGTRYCLSKLWVVYAILVLWHGYCLRDPMISYSIFFWLSISRIHDMLITYTIQSLASNLLQQNLLSLKRYLFGFGISLKWSKTMHMQCTSTNWYFQTIIYF